MEKNWDFGFKYVCSIIKITWIELHKHKKFQPKDFVALILKSAKFDLIFIESLKHGQKSVD